MNPFIIALASRVDVQATIEHWQLWLSELTVIAKNEGNGSFHADCAIVMIRHWSLAFQHETPNVATLRSVQSAVSSARQTALNLENGLASIHSYGTVPSEWTEKYGIINR